jgi:hypothetical protein
MDQRFGICHIVVVSSADSRRVVALEPHETWYVLAIEIQHVGNRHALLQQELASIQILEKRAGAVPPGDVPVDMRAREIGLPRLSHFIR